MKLRQRSFRAAAGWWFARAGILPAWVHLAKMLVGFVSPKCGSPRPHLRSIAAEPERSCFACRRTLRCVSKHEGHAVVVLILRDARTPVRVCETPPARALLGMRTAKLAARRRTVFGSCHLTMSNSPSRSRGAFFRPGLAPLLRQPESRGGRSAESRSGACEAPVGPAHNASGQAPSEAPCVP